MEKPKIITLAVALAALAAPPGQAAVPSLDAATTSTTAVAQAPDRLIQANRFLETNGDVFGFLVTEAADGTVVAQHRSQSSHSSHRSHVSSR